MVGKRRSTVIALAMTVLLSHASAATQPTVYEPYAGPFSAVVVPAASDRQGTRVESTGPAHTPAPASPSPTPLPSPTPRPTPRPTPKQIPRPVSVTRHISHRLATWYCNYTHPEVVWSSCMKVHPDVGGLQMYAAAGPSLRAALGPSWRGSSVKVTAASGLSKWVVLADWCDCRGTGSAIDLYYDAFKALGSPVNPVTISW